MHKKGQKVCFEGVCFDSFGREEYDFLIKNLGILLDSKISLFGNFEQNLENNSADSKGLNIKTNIAANVESNTVSPINYDLENYDLEKQSREQGISQVDLDSSQISVSYKVLVVNFLYSEYLCRSLKNTSYRDFLNSSELNLIDGKGLAFVLKHILEVRQKIAFVGQIASRRLCISEVDPKNRDSFLQLRESFEFVAIKSVFKVFSFVFLMVFLMISAPVVFVYTFMIFWFGVLNWPKQCKNSPFQVFLGRDFVDDSLRSLQVLSHSYIDLDNKKNLPKNTADTKIRQKVVWIIAAGKKNNSKAESVQYNQSQKPSQKQSSQENTLEIDNSELKDCLQKTYPTISFEYLFFDKDGDFMKENWSQLRSLAATQSSKNQIQESLENTSQSSLEISKNSMNKKSSSWFLDVFLDRVFTIKWVRNNFQFLADFSLFDDISFEETQEILEIKNFVSAKIQSEKNLPDLILVALGGASGKQEYAIATIKNQLQTILTQKNQLQNNWDTSISLIPSSTPLSVPQTKNDQNSDKNSYDHIESEGLKTLDSSLVDTSQNKQMKASKKSPQNSKIYYKNIVISGVGAALDRFGAGKKQVLVPLWIQNLGLESFFRWFTNPSRFFRVFYAMSWLYLWFYFQIIKSILPKNI